MKRDAFLAAIAILGLLTPRATAQPAVDFQRDIRPILSNACFLCHGPDDKNRKADLRLDTKDGAFAGLGSGSFALVAGKPDRSEAYARMISSDPKQHMPPAKSGKQVTPAQIALVRKWIEQGAKWSEHWSFVAPQRPKVPLTPAPLPQGERGNPSPRLPLRERGRGEGWIRNPIDAFILARLGQEGFRPSPEADRVTLLRRLSIDLIGLPPTIAEVNTALGDKSPEWYDKQVERLLNSPHYGERWGRHWLDAARYADSDGYEKDKARQVWAYRDWVIGAFNRDLPYNRFIIEQIAGDLLPNATQDQRVATGFLRNSMINEEGGIDPEQFRMEAMFDRMDAIGKSILGLTIQCAQCHSHKFDPLTQEEYYRLFAFLNNCHEANIPVYTASEQMARAELFRKMRDIEADLQHRHPDWLRRMAEWEESVKGNQPAWVIVRPELDASGGQKHYLLEDGSILAAGYAPTKHTTDFAAKTELKKITAVRLELLNEPNLPLGGPGRSPKGLFALSEFRVEVAPADKPGQKQKVKIVKATADVNPPQRDLEVMFDDRTKQKRVTGPIDYAIDGKDDTAWTIDIGPGRSNVPRKAVFVFEKPITFEAGAVLTFHLVQKHGGWNSDDNQNNNLGRFRFALTSAADAVADPLPSRVRAILALPRDKRTPAQVQAVFRYWMTTVPEWKEENDKVEALWRAHPEGASQLVLADRAQQRETHMLKRGDFLKPGKAVTPGVPSFLHPLPAARGLQSVGANRLTLANWLADRQSPTTARALVNRVWQAYFGTGLVSTSEDLGSQCETPSHPELLDWLAVEFMDRGWSLKKLHRLIVTSATYRQTSRVTPELLTKDPANRLLARGPRFRVDAEIVRDIALAASGLLNAEIGGPSVFPPAPAFLFQPPVSYGPKVWDNDKGAERYRRAMYTFSYRSVPFPALQAFDAPNGDFSCVRRARSNTPLQALTTLNEPVFLECARSLGLRTLREGGATDADRLTYAFRRCLTRSPSEAEAKALLALFDRQVQHFGKAGARPWELVASDPTKPPQLPQGTTPAQAAAWTAVARVLLNLDETITKE